MHADAVFRPLHPDTFAPALAVIPDVPWSVHARAALIAGRATVYADDQVHPAAIAVSAPTSDGRTVFLFGDADASALAAYVRALTGPLTLIATDPIAARIPEWRRDATALPCATFTFPASGESAAFAMLPPGGVRRLRPADARHLAAFPEWLWGAYGSPDVMLREGIAYARYLRAELVAIACTTGATEQYEAITAYTIERTRRNGFARECAHRLIGAIVSERGKLPVLTVRAENAAGVGLAGSLGLTERHNETVYEIL